MAEKKLDDLLNVLIDDARVEAGRDYIAALDQAGFRAEGAFWAYRKETPYDPELLLVTTLVDRVGTKTIYDALFVAYEKAKTPREIDPWIVALISPKMVLGTAVLDTLMNRPEPAEMKRMAEKLASRDSVLEEVHQGVFSERLGWVVPPNGIYRAPTRNKAPEATRQIRQWRRFESEVLQAA